MWAVLTENVHLVCKNIWFLFICMLCFHLCFAFMFAHMRVFWYQTCTSPEHSKLPFQTFEKWYNVSYRYVSYAKSETSDIWSTGAWFLKPFGERVEENHIYLLVKPISAVKTRAIYRGCNVYYQVFLENRKVDFKSKIWNFNINFQTYINFFTNPALKHRTKVILTSSSLILNRQIRFR